MTGLIVDVVDMDCAKDTGDELLTFWIVVVKDLASGKRYPIKVSRLYNENEQIRFRFNGTTPVAA